MERSSRPVEALSDVYDDVELPYPDAKMAALLSIGGPCRYKVREDSNVTAQWILTIVVPRLVTKPA